MGFFDGIIQMAAPVAGAYLGGPAGAAVGASIANTMGQSNANQTNRDIAATNNATSIDLANTAMQRKVKDLAAAGLNPMLAYTQGGAAVPNLQQAKVENTAASASSGSLNAATQALLAAQVKTQESQAALNSAETSKSMSEKTGIDFDNQGKASLIPNLPYRAKADMAVQDSTRAEHDLRVIRANNDENTLRYLNERAVKLGYRNMGDATGNADFQKILAETRLRGQEYNIHKPEEIFASGTYGKNVAPYVTSAAHVVNIGNALKSGYK